MDKATKKMIEAARIRRKLEAAEATAHELVRISRARQAARAAGIAEGRMMAKVELIEQREMPGLLEGFLREARAKFAQAVARIAMEQPGRASGVPIPVILESAVSILR